MSNLSAPLWKLLQAVAQALAAVREGRSATAVLAQIEQDLRPGSQALLFQVLRSLGRAQALRLALVKRTPPPAVDALLCTALALLWDEKKAPYDAFTLVNQAVDAAKKSPVTRVQANFINACLRRFLRERQPLVAQTQSQQEAQWNHPGWWVNKLKKQYPHDWAHILEANNRQAPLTLRVNTRKMTPDRYLQLLAEQGLAARRVGEAGIELGQAQAVESLPGYTQGWFSVQDAAAQIAATLLLGGRGGDGPLKVLDACAAPGGKTAHLLEVQACQLLALDIDPSRCERIHQTLARLDLEADVRVGDAGQPHTWWDGAAFDAILLDAPCTASGIVRRHPDVRWLRRESDVGKLAEIQAHLLGVLWPLLKPGGRLLYSTCSVFLEEGALQIQRFLAQTQDAILLPSPGHLMPGNADLRAAVLHNATSDHDGFYYALLEKRVPC